MYIAVQIENNTNEFIYIWREIRIERTLLRLSLSLSLSLYIYIYIYTCIYILNCKFKKMLPPPTVSWSNWLIQSSSSVCIYAIKKLYILISSFCPIYTLVYTHTHTHTHTHIYIYIYMCVCVCISVCVWSKIDIKHNVGWLFGFYGVSIFLGYLTPDLFLYKWAVLFQTIQFSMSTEFNYQKHFYFQLFSLVKQF